MTTVGGPEQQDRAADRRLRARNPLTRHGDRLRFVALLAFSAVVYMWNLSVSGYANNYYSAAALAGSQSWKAMFFASLDAGNAITVDKPPMGVWPMALSVRLFGLSSWSLLMPQAIEGVACVALLYACVRRATGSGTPALIASVAFALTPVTVLVFRYNNPDAMLILLILGAALSTLRALESRRSTWWLVAAGALCGSGFLTKMLEALIVVPALALTYLLYRRASWRRRILDLAAAGLALIVTAGWWVAIVELWPASSRPFIGGSPVNSVLDLAFGYNGVQRISGGGGLSSGLSMANVRRIAHTDIAGEVAWFLPAALLLGLMAWRLSRRHPQRRQIRALLLLSGSWLLLGSLTFASMAGIFHSYYTVLLAPAIATLGAVGAWLAWLRRDEWAIRRLSGSVLAITAATAAAIVHSSAGWSWAAIPIGLGGLAGIVLLWPRTGPRRVTGSVAALLAMAVLAGPALFAAETIEQPHSGSGPTAGPAHSVSIGFLQVLPASAPPPTLAHDLVTTLGRNADHYTWTAAVEGSRAAAADELALRTPVLAIGGYKGTDPAPTLAQFQRLVARHQVHWFLPGGTPGPMSRSIEAWVQSAFVPQLVAGQKVYDLSGCAC